MDVATAERQLLVFAFSNQTHAMDLTDVETIVRPGPITPVAGMAPWILGLMNLRGRILPVASVRRWLGWVQPEITGDDRVIVMNNGTALRGLLVDQVDEIVTIPSHDILPAPPLESQLMQRIVTGVWKQPDTSLMVVIDPWEGAWEVNAAGERGTT